MNIKEQGQDRFLFMAVIVLISFGLFMLYSASWVKSLEKILLFSKKKFPLSS